MLNYNLKGNKLWKNKIFFFTYGFLFTLLFSSISFACYTPTNGSTDDIYFDETNGDNLTICQGIYSFNDTGSPDGIFILTGSNYRFNCNNSVFYGNYSGSNTGLMFLINGNNISLENCNIRNFNQGIYINSSNNNIENINFSLNSNRDIFIKGNNNTINKINSIGNYNGDASIRLSNSINNTISNSIINKPNNGVYIYNSSNNIIKNINITNTGSFAFMLESGDNNYFEKILTDNTGSYSFEIISSFNVLNRINVNNTNYMNGIDIWGVNNIINNSVIFFTDSGIYISGDNNTVNNFSGYNNSYSITLAGNNNFIKNSNLSNNDNYGLTFDSGSDLNLIYNNYFSNNNGGNIFLNANPAGFFNTTKTLGTNIIGGSYIGGNFYDDYNGTDNDGDGIGDSAYNISGIFDYLPLTNNYVGFVKSVNIIIINDSDFYEGDTIKFNISYINLKNPVNLKILNCGSSSIADSNISTPWERDCTYYYDGIYNVSFNLTDNDNDSFIIIKKVNVSNVAPYNISTNYVLNQGINFKFNLSFADPGMFDSFNISIFWGDGSNSNITNTYLKIYNDIIHNYSIDGNYTINISIKDDDNFSNPYSFNISLIQDEFKVLTNNNTIILGNLANLSLFIKNIISTSNLNISWGDGNFIINSTSQSNGSSYLHNYTSFGNFSLNISMNGCKNVSSCSIKEYKTNLWFNVIGYGDGIVNNGEECDTNNFNEKTCSNYGFNAGSLSCNLGVIDSSNCYAQSLGGGGHHKRRVIVDESEEIGDENVTNLSSINVSKIIVNNSINKTEYNLTLINESKMENLSKIINNTKFENQSLIDLENISQNSSLDNITIKIEKNESLFDFKPYIMGLFNLLKLNFNESVFDFKPRISILFTNFGTEINWSQKSDEKYDFKPKIKLLFNHINSSILDNGEFDQLKNQTINNQTILNINDSYFGVFLEKAFERNLENEKENFSFKGFLEKAFERNLEKEKENFSFKGFLEKAFSRNLENETSG